MAGRRTANGARCLQQSARKRALHHLHRRSGRFEGVSCVDRRGGAETKRLDGRGSRSAANSDGTAHTDGRIRSNHQCEGDHGDESARNAGSCADATRKIGPKSGIPTSGPTPKAIGLPGLHGEDESQR